MVIFFHVVLLGFCAVLNPDFLVFAVMFFFLRRRWVFAWRILLFTVAFRALSKIIPRIFKNNLFAADGNLNCSTRFRKYFSARGNNLRYYLVRFLKLFFLRKQCPLSRNRFSLFPHVFKKVLQLAKGRSAIAPVFENNFWGGRKQFPLCYNFLNFPGEMNFRYFVRFQK